VGTCRRRGRRIVIVVSLRRGVYILLPVSLRDTADYTGTCYSYRCVTLESGSTLPDVLIGLGFLSGVQQVLGELGVWSGGIQRVAVGLFDIAVVDEEVLVGVGIAILSDAKDRLPLYSRGAAVQIWTRCQGTFVLQLRGVIGMLTQTDQSAFIVTLEWTRSTCQTGRP
jgi:hypothetical protein